MQAELRAREVSLDDCSIGSWAESQTLEYRIEDANGVTPGSASEVALQIAGQVRDILETKWRASRTLHSVDSFDA